MNSNNFPLLFSLVWSACRISLQCRQVFISDYDVIGNISIFIIDVLGSNPSNPAKKKNMFKSLKKYFNKNKEVKGIKAICVNNLFKPKEIPNHLWIEFNKEYTITDAYINHNNELVAIIDELDLESANITKDGIKYRGYNSMRFRINSDDFEKFIQMITTPTKISNKTLTELQMELDRAVKIEDYEEAVKLRDEINKIN